MKQMRQLWPSWCSLALLDALVGTLSTFWTESCMIGMLGGVLEQNEPTLAILVLLGPIGGAELHSEPILHQVMHDWLAGRCFGAK